MNDMPHKNIDTLRSELMVTRTRRTTFTSIELILIAYLAYWDFIFIVTDSFNSIDSYTVLGDILTEEKMILFLSVTLFIMILAGFTRRKGLRYMALMMSLFLWLIVASSIFVQALNMRSSTIILAVASAYQFIQVAMGRDS